MLTGIPASSGAAIGPFFLLNTDIPVADAQQSQLSPEEETQALSEPLREWAPI
jgi:phosphoenolpyruvate-protein kinase (PTS system EI component)